jgi:hypothetical protein
MTKENRDSLLVVTATLLLATVCVVLVALGRTGGLPDLLVRAVSW